ncbi:sugar phosphate isomerase/epimerase family protein [Brenneria tiliae]|uniref:Sugar phosphate isomerase/epimerase n=1 Tax=Brenneria tiliae TaxID=2914984 RepID=A0ABT0MYW6_9GAMM|nr:sugar phosphate isomerase/epimerase [Brenneria tiliae]MCL2895059.1 sugar phosphate isomerase/epimerase [Brenneria tiliae]
MKLGFVSAILDQSSFEEMIDIASDLGYQCVEVACWPKGKSERRYAGVAHIDVARVVNDDAYSDHIVNYAGGKNIAISSLAYYPNVLDSNVERQQEIIAHIKLLIKASRKLNVGLVTTFIGRDQNKTVEENLELIGDIWRPILELAQSENVKVGIENCPMLFGREQWPGGQNLMTTPDLWGRVFEILPYENLGLNYDPSHFIWQNIDYIKPIYEFKNKIFHIHYKDIKVYKDKLDRVGTMAYPLEYMSPKLPGLGDVNWGKYVSALTDIGYDGYTCIEVEDKAFEGSLARVIDSLRISRLYMKQFVI